MHGAKNMKNILFYFEIRNAFIYFKGFSLTIGFSHMESTDIDELAQSYITERYFRLSSPCK